MSNPINNKNMQSPVYATATVVNPAFVGVTAIAVPVEYEGYVVRNYYFALFCVKSMFPPYIKNDIY